MGNYLSRQRHWTVGQTLRHYIVHTKEYYQDEVTQKN